MDEKSKNHIEKRLQDLLFFVKNIQEKIDNEKLTDQREIEMVIMCLDSAVSELDPIEL
jgi:hypothetical protein